MKKTDTTLNIHDAGQFPELNRERSRLTQLEQQKAALAETLKRSREELKRPRRESIEAQAEDLLAGKTLTEIIDGDPQIRADVDRLERELRIVSEAVERQRARMLPFHHAAKRVIAKSMLPRHTAIAKHMERAMLDLHDAVMADLEFQGDLRRAGGDMLEPLLCIDGFPLGMLWPWFQGKESYGVYSPKDWRGVIPGQVTAEAMESR